MKTRRRAPALLLAVLLTLGTAAGAPVETSALAQAASRAAAYVLETTQEPQVGSVGGEWAVLGLARGGFAVPEGWFQNYYAALEAYAKARAGVLHETKYTEYARVVLALTAIGKDPADVAGYNLLAPLGDFERTVRQGINGPVWALIALDSGNYDIPRNPDAATQATREAYVGEILTRQNGDGGWSLSGAAPSDPDMTGMALQALAKYTDGAQAAAAADRALAFLSEAQADDGGYGSFGVENAESVVQVVVALCELGVPLEDARFVKSGGTLLTSLLGFQREDGGFAHAAPGGGSRMAGEQALYGLVAALRAQAGENSLYRMGDAVRSGGGETAAKGAGLPGKSDAVHALPVTVPDAGFPDLASSEDGEAVAALAARGVVTGTEDGLFLPDGTVTRAQLAALIVRALGLSAETGGFFADVPENCWYAACVDTACQFGIVNGTEGGLFRPDAAVTREAAAAMLARAAALCGMDAGLDAADARDVLAQFGDYVSVSGWARSAVAFCCRESIFDSSALDIGPGLAVTRGEAAGMLCRLLAAANLI